jgi:hypothetical protein
MAAVRNVIRLNMGVAVLVVERVWDIRFLINVKVGLKKITFVLFKMAARHNAEVV